MFHLEFKSGLLATSTPCICEPNGITHSWVSFCCCEGAMCNSELVIPATLPTERPPIIFTPRTRSPGRPQTTEYTLSYTLLLTILPLMVISMVILFLYFVWRKSRLYVQQRQALRQASQEPERLLPGGSRGLGVGSGGRYEDDQISACLPPMSIKKVEVIAHGRYGSVWRAEMYDIHSAECRTVAVKIFPPQDRLSWETEREFYTTVRPHDNILRFVGAEQRGAEFGSELWLVTEYHGRGSLYDHLKSHTIGVQELLKIALTMIRGISYLHTMSREKYPGKPALAHRDLKSKNVLLKRDMTACVADFGLVLKLGPGMGSVHNQVGTRRYMSPEVLDGSINFGVENFLKIDIYATALILWELLSRCDTDDSVKLSEYMMPFEVDVGTKPSLEMMQECVVTKKIRPRILPHWQSHNVLGSVCRTVEECWDQDPEARLSAECIEARLSLMWKPSPSSPALSSSNLYKSISQHFLDRDSSPAATLTTSTTTYSAVL